MRSKRLALTMMTLAMCAVAGCPTTSADDDPADPSTANDPALDAPTDSDDAGESPEIVPPADLDGGWTISTSTLGTCVVVSGGAVTSVNNSCGASLSRLEVDQIVAARIEQNNSVAAAQMQRVVDDAAASGLSPEAVAAQIDAVGEANRQANFLDALDVHLSNAESRLLIGEAEWNNLVSAIESAALGRPDFLAAARGQLGTSTVRVFLASAPDGARSEGDQVVWVIQFRFPGGGTGEMTFEMRRLSDDFLQGTVVAGISSVAVSMIRQ